MASTYNPLLKRIAIGLFPVCAGGSWFFYTKMQDGIIAHSYFPEAMRLMREDPVASERLGKPIFNKYINLTDKWNQIQGMEAKLKIPVKGTKRKGLLIMWATRSQPDIQDWSIQKLHLLTKNDPPLFIYDPETETETDCNPSTKPIE